MTFNTQLLGNYREYPGPGENWDWIPRLVIDYLLRCGLRRDSTLIDVGCGPLRIGRHLIAFLDPGHYIGLEPETSMVTAGLEHEIGALMRDAQRPKFVAKKIGDEAMSADWALAWNVFNHLSPNMLRLALTTIRADNWLVDVHVDDHAFVDRCDGQGWSYRYADAKATVYTPDLLAQLVSDANYHLDIIDTLDSPWKPYAVLWLRSAGACDHYT